MKNQKLKNITLSAPEDLISLARKRASENNGTLNDAFRKWLIQFTKPISLKGDYEELMSNLNGILVDSSKEFSRDKANER